MKIRTDFVTNSSSSSFSVLVRATNQAGEEIAEVSSFYGGKWVRSTDKFRNIGYGDVSSVTSIMNLLKNLSVSPAARDRIKEFITPLKDMDHIDISVVWDSHGESSGCTVYNDDELKKLAGAVTAAKKGEQEQALKAFTEYLDSATVYAEGAWVSETWPVGFWGNPDENARYGWEAYRDNPAKLAKMIVDDKCSGDDLALETLSISCPEKKTALVSELMVDGKRSILKPKRRKPADAPEKSKEPVVLIPLDTVETESAPQIDLGGWKFSYADIDSVPASFLQDADVPLKNSKVQIGNFNVSVSLEQSFAKAGQMAGSGSLKWFDAKAFSERWEKWTQAVDRGDFTWGDLPVLTPEQVKQRASVFRKVMNLCSNTAVLRRIVEEYPKKNNGLLYKKRILKIAWMYALAELEFTAEDGRKLTYPALFQLYAQADEDTELTVTARMYDPLQYLTGLEQNDLIVKTNLFSDLQAK